MFGGAEATKDNRILSSYFFWFVHGSGSFAEQNQNFMFGGAKATENNKVLPSCVQIVGNLMSLCVSCFQFVYNLNTI